MINDSQINDIELHKTPLELEEGYELAIRSIDIDGNKVYLELIKDGEVVDSEVIIPRERMLMTSSSIPVREHLKK